MRFLFQDIASLGSPVGRLAAALWVQAAIVIDRGALGAAFTGFQTARTADRDIAAAVRILMGQKDLACEKAYQLLRIYMSVLWWPRHPPGSCASEVPGSLVLNPLR